MYAGTSCDDNFHVAGPVGNTDIVGIAGFGMGLAYSTPSLIVLREAPVAVQGAATAGLQRGLRPLH